MKSPKITLFSGTTATMREQEDFPTRSSSSGCQIVRWRPTDVLSRSSRISTRGNSLMIQFFNPRRADTMEKAELVLFHHHQIMAQPPEWRLENAMDICRQFTLYFAPILSPYPFSSSFDCYEPSSDFINL